MIPVADDFSSIARRLKEITTGNPPAETSEATPIGDPRTRVLLPEMKWRQIDYTPADPNWEPDPYRPGDCG